MTQTTSKMEAFFLCQKQARGDLGKTLVADQIINQTLGVVDDASEFGYLLMGEHDLDGLYIWRYPLYGNDEVKRITGVYPPQNNGRVTVESTWVNETDANYVMLGIHPFKILDTMEAAYSRLTMNKDVVLTIGGSDLDMERSDAGYWDGTYGFSSNTNCTVSKEVANPENKRTGDYSLKITLTAAGGSLLGPAIRAVPGKELVVAPCLRAISGGPFTVRLWDSSHGVFFGQPQEYSGAEFAYLFIGGAVVPEGCDYWQLSITGTDSGAVAWLDSVSARSTTDSQFMLEEWVDETYKLPLIHRVKFKGGSTGNASGDQFAAPDRQYAGDLVLNQHYHVTAEHTAINRYVLDIEPEVDLGRDIFYLASRRQRNLVEPWTDKFDSTTAPRGELTAYLMYELSSLLLKETKDPYWAEQHAEWGARLGEEVKPRSEPAYQPPREVIVVKR